MIILIFLGLGLRLLRLTFQPLWWDEGYSVWFAAQPLGRMLALTAQDIHPPLYYALLHGWTLLFGAGPVALRLLSVLIGTLTVPLLYLAARRLLSPRGALLAAALLAINPLHIYYSQEVRMYGLVALLSTGILAAAWCVFDPATGRHGDGAKVFASPCPRVTLSPCHLVTYILLTTAALYTQYYAVFLPVGLTFYALWHWRRETRKLLSWLAAQLVVAVLYLPWALYAAPKLVLYVSQKVVADADKPLGPFMYLARHLAAFLAGHLERPLAPWWPVALALLVPLAVGWWLATRRRGDAAVGQRGDESVPASQCLRVSVSPCLPVLITVLLTALVLGWLIGLRYPFFPARGERLLLLALPPFILLAAAGLDALWRRWRGVGLIMLGLVVATSVASTVAFYTVPRYPNDDYRTLIGRMVEQGLPGDTVFAVYPWQVGYWRSYGSANGPTAVLSPSAAWGPEVATALDDALARGRVWFPAHLALGGILETQIETRLADEAASFVNAWYGPNTRLSAWAPAGADAFDFTREAPASGLPVRFVTLDGVAVTLRAVSGSTAPIPAANAVTPLALAWQANAAPPVLAVSVRLTDDLGQIWAQHDYEPLGNSSLPSAAQNDNAGRWQATDRLGLLIPAGTPPGRYTVEVLVQTKGGGRPLEAIGADGRSLGTLARLYTQEIVTADRSLGPERLPIGTRAPADLGDGLRFLGFTVDDSPAAPGDLRKASLFWQATATPSADTVAFLQLLDRSGNATPLWEAPPGAACPTSRWTPGTLMRTQAAYRIPATLPDGRYRLITGLYRPADGSRLRTPQGKDYVFAGTVTVRGRPHDMQPPTPDHPADVRLGDLARLAGYDIPVTETAPGAALDVTLYWQAQVSGGRAYTVFVHLLDEAGDVRGYGDSEPGAGKFPTSGWLAGEYLADRHTVTVGPDAGPGIYRLAIGLYDPATGKRLTTPDGADHVLLDAPITVR